MTFLNVHFLLAVFRKVMRGPPEMSRLSLSLSLVFLPTAPHTQSSLPLFLSRATPHRARAPSLSLSSYATQSRLFLSSFFQLPHTHRALSLSLSLSSYATQRHSVSLPKNCIHKALSLCLFQPSTHTTLIDYVFKSYPYQLYEGFCKGLHE